MSSLMRVSVGVAAAVVTALAGAGIGSAQDTTTTTISWAAESDAAGLLFELAPGTGPTIGGAVTHAEITSAGPKASGFGQGLTGADQTRAETAAPPDDQQTASGGGTSQDIGGLLEFTLGGGNATSESRVRNDLPSTVNSAALGVAAIAADPVANPLGAGFEISVAAFGSEAAAGATSATDISSSAAADGVVVSITVDVDVLGAVSGLQDQVCSGLGQIPGIGGDLEQACDDVFGTLTGQQPFAEIRIGPSNVACSWNGTQPTSQGQGATVVVEILGQEPLVVAPGEVMTVAEGTPLEITAGAGFFVEDRANAGPGQQDSVSARAGGAFLSLFAEQVNLALGDSTCGLSGVVETTTTPIARTGGEVLPMLLGGAGITAAGFGLRRFLRRPR